MSKQRCLNCGTPLEGPYCHVCGQPVKGMIRHFKSVIGDVLDTVFEYDSRIWRTLGPLYFLPGRLTMDFVAGRRVRFVTPFRLVFVLLVLAFLVLQLRMGPELVAGDAAEGPPGIFDATTVAAVEAARERTLERLERSAEESGALDDEARRQLEIVRRAVHEEAARRIDWLKAAEAARQEGRAPPPEALPRPRIYLDGEQPWDAETNPLVIDWLPGFANDQLNVWLGRAVANLERAQQDPERFFEAFLGLLPAAAFVLMPILALLLKIFYLFSGRLYMEHMVATLHSHAFLGLAILVSATFDFLAEVAPRAFGLNAALEFLLALSLAWIPVYLLIMQRRVYGQGWLTTVIKFLCVGAVYSVLLGTAVAVAAVVTLIRG